MDAEKQVEMNGRARKRGGRRKRLQQKKGADSMSVTGRDRGEVKDIMSDT